MAVSMDVIKRVVIQGSSQGLDKVEGDLRKLASTADGVNVSFEKASRSQLSAEAAYKRLSASIDPIDRAQQQIAKGTNTLNRAFQEGLITQDDYQKRLGQLKEKYSVASAANDNLAKSQGLARYEMINLSRQIQDVGVSLVSGQSPFTVLVQQGSQIGDIFSNTTGTFKGFVSQIASAITPVRLLSAGFIGIGAALVAGLASWKNFALQIDDLAHVAGTTTAEMAKLQAVASFKGISQDEFAGGIKQLASGIYEAQTGAGELAKLFRCILAVRWAGDLLCAKSVGLSESAGGDRHARSYTCAI